MALATVLRVSLVVVMRALLLQGQALAPAAMWRAQLLLGQALSPAAVRRAPLRRGRASVLVKVRRALWLLDRASHSGLADVLRVILLLGGRPITLAAVPQATPLLGRVGQRATIRRALFGPAL